MTTNKGGNYMNNLSSNTMWQNYSYGKSSLARQQLIEQYLGLVKYVVNKLKINLPPSVQHDDLIQIGVIGLCEAIERFDSSLGIKF